MFTKESVRAAAPAAVIALALGFLAVDVNLGAVAVLVATMLIAYRTSIWIAAVAVAWALCFLAVLYLPGPYDSWAGRAALPVLTCYVGLFLAAWAYGRSWSARREQRRRRSGSPDAPPDASSSTVSSSNGSTSNESTASASTVSVSTMDGGGGAGAAVADKRQLGWPSEYRLRLYVFGLLVLAIVAAVLRFWGTTPPIFSSNPDVARELLRYHTNIYLGLLWEAWTIGVSVSLFRLLAGPKRGRWLYLPLTVVFIAGSALGASKNSVLIGIATGMIATLSVRLRRSGGSRLLVRRSTVAVVVAACAALGVAVYLGGQRTIAGTGNFENQFRSEYGNNAVTATFGSLDLSLSSSVETFGRLWSQQDTFPRGYGRYSLIFSGSPGHKVLDAHSDVDLYSVTSQLSQPYYMNTATFVAIPLLDFGLVGAGIFLVLIGLAVGFWERRFEFRDSAALQLGRATIIYFAGFGIYELYPLVQPTWLSTIPGLWVLHLLTKRAKPVKTSEVPGMSTARAEAAV
jgi:hypothetical protein